MGESAANIGPRQRRRRLAMGIVMLLVGLGVIGALIAGGADRGWRLLAVLPFWIGALGILQARAAT